MKPFLLCIGLTVCSEFSVFADEPTVARPPQQAIRAKAIRATSAAKASLVPSPVQTLPSTAVPVPAADCPHVEETQRKNVNSVSVDLSPVPAMGLKKWEALLAEPADLDFEGRKTVSVKELIDGLRERHELSLRIDIPTISALVGVEHLMTKSNAIRQAKGKPSAYADGAKRVTSVQLAGGPVNRDSSPVVESIPESSGILTELGISNRAASDDEKSDVEKSDDDAEEYCDDDDCEGKADIADSDADESEINIIEKFLTLEVNVQTMDLRKTSVSSVLRQALDAMPIVLGADFAEIPFPISLSNACLLDYLVEKDGLVITTRMQALSQKETRVYSLKNLKEVNSEQLAKIVRQSIRPWSWRSQINDLGDQLRGSLQLPPEMVQSIVKTGVELASAQAGATVTISDSESANGKTKNEASDAEQLNALGNATVNGLVTFAHATVLGLEMAHHADFPTGTILTLPGKLIVTQSQAAHREIADLLKQLADE